MVFYNEPVFWYGIIAVLLVVFVPLLFYASFSYFRKRMKTRKKRVDKDPAKKPGVVKDTEEVMGLDTRVVRISEMKADKFYVEVDPYDYLSVYKMKKFFFLPFTGRMTKVPHPKRRKVWKRPDKFVKVRFKLLNDRVVEFPVIASLVGFMFRKGKYLFDESAKYETIQGQELIPTYDFHEALDIPVKVRLRMNNSLLNYIEQHDHNLKKQVYGEGLKESLKKDRRLLQLIENYEEMLKNPIKADIHSDEIKDVLESGNVSETENIYNPHTLHRYLKSDFIQQLVKGVLAKLIKIIFWILILIGLAVIVILVLNVITTLQLSGFFEQIQGTP